MTKAGFWLNAMIATVGIAAFVALAAFFGFKWFADDEPNRSYSCGSGSRGGTCFSGETTNMLLTLVFASLAVIRIVLFAKSVRAHRRTEREQFGWQVVSYPVHAPGGEAPVVERLRLLDTLREVGAISETEYRRRREQVIADI